MFLNLLKKNKFKNIKYITSNHNYNSYISCTSPVPNYNPPYNITAKAGRYQTFFYQIYNSFSCESCIQKRFPLIKLESS